mmetsp:Transcript_35333/g.110861  ORF Transcript_35333/g.110861 Transcript_35333/m.110861 type:complete len:227 (+) Transcript_35333:636-1316(+)
MSKPARNSWRTQFEVRIIARPSSARECVRRQALCAAGVGSVPRAATGAKRSPIVWSDFRISSRLTRARFRCDFSVMSPSTMQASSARSTSLISPSRSRARMLAHESFRKPLVYETFARFCWAKSRRTRSGPLVPLLSTPHWPQSDGLKHEFQVQDGSRSWWMPQREKLSFTGPTASLRGCITCFISSSSCWSRGASTFAFWQRPLLIHPSSQTHCPAFWPCEPQEP